MEAKTVGLHLSRDALQADHSGDSPGSTSTLLAVDWRWCPEAGEDAGAPRVGLSRLKLVAKMLIDYPSWKSAFNLKRLFRLFSGEQCNLCHQLG